MSRIYIPFSSKIFISYSRKDILFVKQLTSDLEDAGYIVWDNTSNLSSGDRQGSERGERVCYQAM